MKDALYLVLVSLLAWMPIGLLGQPCQFAVADCSIASRISAFPYVGRMSEYINNSGSLPGCPMGSFHNSNWYKIQLTSDSIEIEISPSNCSNGEGLQAILFDDCNGSPVATRCDCSGNEPFILEANNLTPGTYYILLDGCDRDVCDFEIELLQGSIMPYTNSLLRPFEDSIKVDQDNFCVGNVVTFEVAAYPEVINYEWELPSGAIIINRDCNRILVLMAEETSGWVTVKLMDEFTTVEAIPYFIESRLIRGPTLRDSFCFPDEPGVIVDGETYPAGGWEIRLRTASGCDSIIFLEVIEIMTPITFESFTICEGDSVQYNGVTFDTPGSYDFSLPGSQGCDSTVIVTIEMPTPQISFDITEDYCGLCEGTINVEVTNGAPPFTYQWGNGATTQQIDNLCPGSMYELTLTDANGCTHLDTAQLASSSSLDLQLLTEHENLYCRTNCTGQIELFINCGTPPYQIDWSGNLPDGETLVTGLCVGTYSVEVSDAGGDTLVQEITLTSPPEIIISGTVTGVTCNGGADGEIDLEVQGGVAPYWYLWSTSWVWSNPTNIAAGTYSVTVTDANGCTASAFYTVSQPPVLDIAIQSTDMSCLGFGEATANVTGGTSPYNYSWSNGEMGMSISDLTPGDYTLTVVDVNGCTAVSLVNIATSTQLLLESTPANCDSTGGSATVNLLGSTSNPSYAWSNGGSGATQNNLAPGWYSVTVTDENNGCMVHRNVQVPLDTACFVRISGYVYDDNVNKDCIIDATTSGQRNILIQLGNGDRTFTNLQGYYEFDVIPGTYDVDLILNSPAFGALCGTTISVAASTLGESYPDNNFFLEKNGIQDLHLKVNKRNARPGFTQWVNICVMNLGTVPMNGTLTFVHDPIQEYLSTNIPYSDYDQANKTITWDFTNHPAGETIIYRVDFQIPLGTPLGQVLNMYFKADPISGDLTPADNEINCAMEVTGSFDPNDKQVTPEGFGDEGGISMQDTLLTYQIRFQNTGTDTAFTVVLRDTLDNNLDPNSVVPGPSSHPYELTFLKGNILEFTFDNIMLPDSFVNESASNGFVFFDVKVKPGLEYGDMMENTAAIYFDFNEPVITNTVTNTLRRPVGVFEPKGLPIQLKVTPNPTTGEAILDFELAEALDLRMTLHDLQGKLLEEIGELHSYKIGKYRQKIDLSKLSQGVYFVNLQTEEGRSSSIRILKID